mmetsp:Transcript_8184/g.33682  ORF Transcript_8184/g.33682 Transcript_8184/m.33682 type:complete len:371 (+) Transcript_8184:404-1516(+)
MGVTSPRRRGAVGRARVVEPEQRGLDARGEAGRPRRRRRRRRRRAARQPRPIAIQDVVQVVVWGGGPMRSLRRRSSRRGGGRRRPAIRDRGGIITNNNTPRRGRRRRVKGGPQRVRGEAGGALGLDGIPQVGQRRDAQVAVPQRRQELAQDFQIILPFVHDGLRRGEQPAQVGGGVAAGARRRRRLTIRGLADVGRVDEDDGARLGVRRDEGHEPIDGADLGVEREDVRERRDVAARSQRAPHVRVHVAMGGAEPLSSPRSEGRVALADESLALVEVPDKLGRRQVRGRLVVDEVVPELVALADGAFEGFEARGVDAREGLDDEERRSDARLSERVEQRRHELGPRGGVVYGERDAPRPRRVIRDDAVLK